MLQECMAMKGGSELGVKIVLSSANIYRKTSLSRIDFKDGYTRGYIVGDPSYVAQVFPNASSSGAELTTVSQLPFTLRFKRVRPA